MIAVTIIEISTLSVNGFTVKSKTDPTIMVSGLASNSGFVFIDGQGLKGQSVAIIWHKRINLLFFGRF